MSIEWHKNRENVRKKRQEEFVFHEKLIQFYWAMAKFFMSLLPIKDWFWKEIQDFKRIFKRNYTYIEAFKNYFCPLNWAGLNW